jgi:hypothetical protein
MTTATDLVTVPTPTVTPLILLEQAIDKGLDADQLGKLMDLQERYESSQAKSAYARAMVACQREMPVIVRNRMNGQTNSKYATLETIQEKIKGIYLKHGFSLSHGSADSPMAGHYRATCTVTHEGGHSEFFFLDVPPDDKGIKGSTNKTAIQALGSSLSYAQRYLECRIWDLTIADQDNDGNRPARTINESDAIQLKELIESKGVDIKRFLDWAEVDKVELLPQSKHSQAIAFLNRK